jgi:hypothetical protein
MADGIVIADDLERELTNLLVESETEWAKDERDLMVAMAPFHVEARRRGLDVDALFRRAATRGPATLAETVLAFGARADVTPEAFGFVVEETAAGRRYRFGRTIDPRELADLEDWLGESRP